MSMLRSEDVFKNTLLIFSILRYLSILYLACSVDSFAPSFRRTKNASVKSIITVVRTQNREERKQQLFNNKADRKMSKKKSDDDNTTNMKKSTAKQGVELVDNLQVKKIRCVLQYLHTIQYDTI